MEHLFLFALAQPRADKGNQYFLRGSRRSFMERLSANQVLLESYQEILAALNNQTSSAIYSAATAVSVPRVGITRRAIASRSRAWTFFDSSASAETRL